MRLQVRHAASEREGAYWRVHAEHSSPHPDRFLGISDSSSSVRKLNFKVDRFSGVRSPKVRGFRVLPTIRKPALGGDRA